MERVKIFWKADNMEERVNFWLKEMEDSIEIIQRILSCSDTHNALAIFYITKRILKK